MSYRKGDLQVAQRCPQADEDGYCDHDDDHRVPMDSRNDYERPKVAAYLPHSCDEWVIGGPEQVRAMIADLQEALKVMGGEEA